jgi:hypothetical protein
LLSLTLLKIFKPPFIFGLQINSKYDEGKEEEARQWIECVIGEQVFEDKSGAEGVHEALKDGKVLCR